MPWKRLLWALVSIAIAVLLVYGLLNIAEEDARGQPFPPLLHSAYDERLNALDREAIEAAYRNQITNLFAGWMRDSTGQPQRALVGTRQARKAFIDSMTQLDQRPKQ